MLYKYAYNTEDTLASEDIPAEFEEPATHPASAEATSAASTITALAGPSSFNISTVSSDQLSGTSFSSERMTAVGHSVGKGGMGKAGKIFGSPISARKLGVVLDISFSTHDVIDIAIEEIQRTFPDALIVLAPGCGMVSRVKGKVLPAEQIIEAPQRYEIEGLQYQMSAFMPRLLKTNEGFRILCEHGIRQKRMFALALLNKDADTPKALVTGTQHAFKFLEKQRVDCIYWLADYEDAIETDLIKNLGAELREHKITVFQHDLDMKAPPAERFTLAEITGGKVIRGNPKQLLER